MRSTFKIVSLTVAVVAGIAVTVAVVDHHRAEVTAKAAAEAQARELAERKAAAAKAAADANEGEKKAAKFFAPVKTSNFRFDQ